RLVVREGDDGERRERGGEEQGFQLHLLFSFRGEFRISRGSGARRPVTRKRRTREPARTGHLACSESPRGRVRGRVMEVQVWTRTSCSRSSASSRSRSSPRWRSFSSRGNGGCT